MELMISPVAVFVLENGKVKEKIEIGRDIKEIVKKFENGDVKGIIEKLEEKYGKLERIPLKIELLIQEGYFKNDEEVRKFLNRFGIEWTKKRIKRMYTPDKLVIQAIDFVEDLNEMINKFYERLREWYGVYFPEAVKEIDDLEKFLKIISENPKREEVAKKIKIQSESMGLDLNEEDIKIIKAVAERGYDLLKLKKEVSQYIRDIMEENYPNFTKLAGALIGAKLISLAGGVEQLVRMPASTIQVLGAEKALFRHLTKGTSPPKHGIIFQHPLVNRSPKKIRGKIARTLAAKLSIAIKVDYYSKGKEIIYDKLEKEIKERIEELKKK